MRCAHRLGTQIKMSFFDYIKAFFLGRQDSDDDTDLEQHDDDDVDPFNPFPEPVRIEITDVIDLHTIDPKDVKRVIEEYLEQVHRAGFESVRIIHGKGIGVQREMVRSVLARTPFVDTWSDAPPDAGGLGATIVRLV
jgi:dsDNA-specific endonuclease/ATPase MutS2